MIFKRLDIKEIIEIIPNKIIDKRGYFLETFRIDKLNKFLDYNLNFCQENESLSHKNVFRGLHYQTYPYAQSKLIRVIKGSILDVVLDLRKKSSSFGKILTIEINDKNANQLFIPKGFAHGFLVLSDIAIINYKVDEFYSKKNERIICINDPMIKISNKETFKLSRKDLEAPYIKDADIFDI